MARSTGPVQVKSAGGEMSATLRTSPSWLGSLAHSSSPLIDTRFLTFTAKTNSPRATGSAAFKVINDNTYRGRRGAERNSPDDKLGDIEGIGVAKDGAWSISICEGTKLGARKVTVYVTTPTSNLTLLRTPSELLELHSRVRALLHECLWMCLRR